MQFTKEFSSIQIAVSFILFAGKKLGLIRKRDKNVLRNLEKNVLLTLWSIYHKVNEHLFLKISTNQFAYNNVTLLITGLFYSVWNYKNHVYDSERQKTSN